MWDDVNGKAVWTEEDVLPDSSMASILMTPSAAFDLCFPDGCKMRTRPDGIKTCDWRNHILSLYSIVYELCIIAKHATNETPGKSLEEPRSLLDHMEEQAGLILNRVSPPINGKVSAFPKGARI